MAHGVEVSFLTGRRVRLEQLHVLPTRVVWSGSKSRQMEERIPDLVAKFFGTDVPFVIRNAERSHLPWTCFCLFESDPMVRYDVTIEASLLIACWFSSEIGVPVYNLVCEGLSGLDWEANAKDFHSDW